MPKFFYCPYCGDAQLNTFSLCRLCGKYITPIESKYEVDYYEKLANDNPNTGNFIDHLLKEVAENPLYNEEYRNKLVQQRSDASFARFMQKQAETKAAMSPKCPTCGSTNIKRLTALNRGAHAWAFGLFSKTARSQWECCNCKTKW